jgi:hypothetical protein
MTPELLASQTALYARTVAQLREATTEVELERAAQAIDSPAFMELPTPIRDELDTLYLERFQAITGALG